MEFSIVETLIDVVSRRVGGRNESLPRVVGNGCFDCVRGTRTVLKFLQVLFHGSATGVPIRNGCRTIARNFLFELATVLTFSAPFDLPILRAIKISRPRYVQLPVTSTSSFCKRTLPG